MKVHQMLIAGIVLPITLAGTVAAQDDETRQATGLPIMIGENVARGNFMNISGKITLEYQVQPKRAPVITIIAMQAGLPSERAVATDAGYYLIRNVRRENVSVVVEIDGIEAARQHLVAPPMSNPRQDFTIPWNHGSGTAQRGGVIDASSLYDRSDKNEELFRQAKSAVRAGDPKRAYEFFNTLLAGDPKDYVAWTELGSTFFSNNSANNAEACYFKALQLRKDYFPALLNLGKLYLSRQRYDDAILALNNAVKINSDSADAHYYLGETYLRTRKGNSAEYHFIKALKIAPAAKSEVHLRLASLYVAANQKGKAAAEYRAFLDKNPDYAERTKLEAFIKENS